MRFLAVATALLILACGNTYEVSQNQTEIEFEVISKGQTVDFVPYVKPGQITIFDFYADWCAPCRKVDKSLKDMKRLYGDRMVVYKLDIVKWESELAVEHGIKDLPYLIYYDENQKLVGKGPSNGVLSEIVASLNANP